MLEIVYHRATKSSDSSITSALRKFKLPLKVSCFKSIIKIFSFHMLNISRLDATDRSSHYRLPVPVRVTALKCRGNLLARVEGTEPFVFKQESTACSADFAQMPSCITPKTGDERISLHTTKKSILARAAMQLK